MKSKLLLFLMMLVCACNCDAQTPAWDKWKWLIGNWEGQGSGKPGEGKGAFSLQEDLSGKILLRKNHSEYPATDNKPAIIHDDLMIVYRDLSGNPNKAIYFDNEGHTINYSISMTDLTITFMSDKTPDMPLFRLTYTMIDKETVDIKFEMSRDGQNFSTYTTGRCKRKN